VLRFIFSLKEIKCLMQEGDILLAGYEARITTINVNWLDKNGGHICLSTPHVMNVEREGEMGNEQRKFVGKMKGKCLREDLIIDIKESV
jgi:hypothetical protein